MKILSLALLLAATVHATNIDIQWSIQSYEDVTVQVGDTITFTWETGHNVQIYPSGSCDAAGAILVGDTPPVVYTFAEEDVDQELFFTCSIDGHCDAGQHITVEVTAATGSEAPTGVPGEPESGSIAPTAVPVETGSESAAPTAVPGAASDSAVPTAVPGADGAATASLAPSAVLGTGTDSTAPSSGPGAASGSESPSIEDGSGTQAPTASGSVRMMTLGASIASTASALACLILY